MTYTRSPEVPPVTVRFEDIHWPGDLELPWMAPPPEHCDDGLEPDDDLIRQYGSPVYYSETPSGGLYVSRINEPYWAALYAARTHHALRTG